MWYMTYGSVLVGPESFHHLEKSILDWFLHHKHTTALFLFGPCGSGKTQILKRNIPGAYLADPETTKVNDHVLSTHIPIFNYSRDMVTTQVLPMQIFESDIYPSKYERLHYFSNVKIMTTQNCIPTNEMLEDYIRTIMTSLNILGDIPSVNIINGDVRAEITRIEFQLTQYSHPTPKPNGSSMVERMDQIVYGGDSVELMGNDYFIVQTHAYDYFNPDKWSELNSMLDTYPTYGDEFDDDHRFMKNTIFETEIPQMMIGKTRTSFTNRNTCKLPPFATLFTWNLAYKYKSLWRFKPGRWELFVTDNISDQDVLDITKATFEDMAVYFKSDKQQHVVQNLKHLIKTFWRPFIKNEKLRRRYYNG